MNGRERMLYWEREFNQVVPEMAEEIKKAKATVAELTEQNRLLVDENRFLREKVALLTDPARFLCDTNGRVWKVEHCEDNTDN